jgi:methionyl-tRNA synthetase
VDIGQEQRTVVAGIAESYRPEVLIGKSVLLVANLAPRTLRGVESQGMILAAESDGQIVLASFDAPVNPGAKVT